MKCSEDLTVNYVLTNIPFRTELNNKKHSSLAVIEENISVFVWVSTETVKVSETQKDSDGWPSKQQTDT